MHPPVDGARVGRGSVLESDRPEGVADRVADGRPHLEARVVGGDPKRLEQEAGQREEEEAAEENPVAEHVAAGLLAQRLGRLDRPPVAEAEGSHDAPLDHEVGESEDEGRAEEVEEE